jgi:hypothetical protein
MMHVKMGYQIGKGRDGGEREARRKLARLK